MASFTDLVRAQRQSGKSVVTSLSGAYNQMNMQKYELVLLTLLDSYNNLLFYFLFQ